jgi:hypothetical protein
LFPYAFADLPEPVCHYCPDAEDVDGWAEASCREVSFVLYCGVALHGRHVLRHLVLSGGGWKLPFLRRGDEDATAETRPRTRKGPPVGYTVPGGSQEAAGWAIAVVIVVREAQLTAGV